MRHVPAVARLVRRRRRALLTLGSALLVLALTAGCVAADGTVTLNANASGGAGVTPGDAGVSSRCGVCVTGRSGTTVAA